MARGKVKKWLPDRAVGWIRDDADGAEVFFGARDLRGLAASDLRPGLDVEFDRGQNARGPTARNVRPAGAPQMDGGRRPPVGGSSRPERARESAGAGAIPMPPDEISVPRSLRALLDRVPSSQRHP